MDYLRMGRLWTKIGDILFQDVIELRNAGERKLAKDMYDIVHTIDGVVSQLGIESRKLKRGDI